MHLSSATEDHTGLSYLPFWGLGFSTLRLEMVIIKVRVCQVNVEMGS
jgi:hypothetical protein